MNGVYEAALLYAAVRLQLTTRYIDLSALSEEQMNMMSDEQKERYKERLKRA